MPDVVKKTGRFFSSPEECAAQLDAWCCGRSLAIRASVIRDFAAEHWHHVWTKRDTWLRELRRYAANWEFARC